MMSHIIDTGAARNYADLLHCLLYPLEKLKDAGEDIANSYELEVLQAVYRDIQIVTHDTPLGDAAAAMGILYTLEDKLEELLHDEGLDVSELTEFDSGMDLAFRDQRVDVLASLGFWLNRAEDYIDDPDTGPGKVSDSELIDAHHRLRRAFLCHGKHGGPIPY